MSGLFRAAPPLALLVILCMVGVQVASAATGRGVEFHLGQGMHADALAVGPDGNIWFAGTRYGSGAPVDVVGRSTPDGQITEFLLPARAESELGISSLVAAADGHLYFTEPNGNRIGQISTTGEIFELELPNPGSRPRVIAAAPDGSLWFSEEGGDRVARFSPLVKVLRERDLTPGALPTGIAARADGTIWVAEPGVDGFAVVTTSGISSFHIPFADAGPNAVVPGPEGHVWLSEEKGPWLGRITSAALTKGSYERLVLPTRQGTRQLAFGPVGDFWYTSGNRIGSVSPSYWAAAPACIVAGCDVPVTALVAGPEDELWYATGMRSSSDRTDAGTIGRFLPPRIAAIVTRPVGRLAGRHVKFAIDCDYGAAGEFCRGHLRLLGRLGGKSGISLLGSRSLLFRSSRKLG